MNRSVLTRLFLKRHARVWLPALVGFAASLPVAAHHSFAAGYDIERPLSLQGVISQAVLGNPHGQLSLEVVGRGGVVQHWTFELAAPSSLEARGLKSSDLSPGSRVRVRGYRSKLADATAYSVLLILADGRAIRTGGPDCPVANSSLSPHF